MPPISTSQVDLQAVFLHQKIRALQLRESTVAQRIDKIRRLRQALLAHQSAFINAGMADSGKPESEVLLGEMTSVLLEMADAIRHLKRWMQPCSVKPSLLMMGSRSEIRVEPKGVCLILAPWNFPVALSLGPLVSAIAVGNTAILKPSELTPHLSAVINHIISDALSSDDAHVVTGDVHVAEALLTLPFDHIFFTGSPEVGKRVMAAAAHHLSSVTLELGGKCPVVILPDADLKLALRQIVTRKSLNCGQICLAPDHIYVPRASLDAFLHAMKTELDTR